MTTNADIFKDSINKLSASGGGDIPELCLSGLQVLTGVFFTVIFLESLIYTKHTKCTHSFVKQQKDSIVS